MKSTTSSEADLRAKLQRAYEAVDYADSAAVDRIVARLDGQDTQRRFPRRVASGLAGVAAAALAVVVIAVMLTVPRGSAPASQPAPKATTVKQWALGIGIGAGSITFIGHDLPPNSKVALSMHQGSVYSEFSTTTDTQGTARVTTPAPAGLVPGVADFSICVGASIGGMTCVSQTVQVPSGTTSLPAPTPSCPPGTRETSRSSPSANGSSWIGCLGVLTQSP